MLQIIRFVVIVLLLVACSSPPSPTPEPTLLISTPTPFVRQPIPFEPQVGGLFSGLLQVDDVVTIHIRDGNGREVAYGTHAGNGSWEMMATNLVVGNDYVVSVEADGYSSQPMTYTIRLDGNQVAEMDFNLDFAFSPSGDSALMSLSSSVFFPKQELVDGEWVRVTGEIVGTLVEVDGCLRLNSSHDEASYLVVWPPSYVLDASGDRLLIRDEMGQVMASVGEMVHMGGGETVSLEGVVGINVHLIEGIPTECVGPYWVSGGIIANAVEDIE